MHSEPRALVVVLGLLPVGSLGGERDGGRRVQCPVSGEVTCEGD